MLRVGDHRELQAAVLALKGVEPAVRSAINKDMVATMGPVWKQLVAAHATTHQDTRFLVPGTRIAGGNPPVAVAANSRRKIGRQIPNESWQGIEFGAHRALGSTYQRRSPKGNVHTVTRRTRRHLPPRTPKGRVVYPAFAELAPRVVSYWVQSIVRIVAEAAEGER